MKQKALLELFLLVMILILLIPGFSVAKTDSSVQEMEYTTGFSYHGGLGDSKETAHALALFGAKHEAVVLSARYFASKGLLSEVGDKLMAVSCLVADDLRPNIIYESFSGKSTSCTIKITSKVSLIDFVKAEIKNTALEKNEMQFTLKEEMDPVVSATINPAQELSRVYRYLARQEWRMAIIYLDRLEKKYPYWSALFLAKALGFQGMHEAEWQKEALSSACNLGNNEACLQLERFEQSN